ncbi:phage holin family protein [Nonomuraea jiangxiensis]|uniref:Putative Holin-X, holin superfamily III n=1 Tax=Nonomuraea jiangxiensis TaxID=633440 RepID=A0A1G8D1D7_9ACTN|nr:phage holin family protein [Nonomuraea jiangxiensis]SDH51364.1 Putative Holin-X, holin superfamily III [Nonomuraea jiangxiensis]
MLVNDTHKLVNDLSEQVSRLVRDEFRLARMELAEKGKHARFGVGLFGAAGTAAFFGGASLVAAAIMLLARVMPGWAAAAVMAVILFACAGLLGLVGRKQVKQVGTPVPEETIASVKADIDMVKERSRR